VGAICDRGKLWKFFRLAYAKGNRKASGDGKAAFSSQRIRERWLILRVVESRRATLQEIETYYTLEDLLEVNEAIDMMEEARAQAVKQSLPRNMR
jgi:hypothetical protein